MTRCAYILIVCFVLVPSNCDFGWAQELSLGGEIDAIKVLHNLIFSQNPVITAGSIELAECSSNPDDLYHCDFMKIEGAIEAIKTRLSVQQRMDHLFDSVTCKLHSAENGMALHPDLRTVERHMKNVIEYVEENQDKSEFFVKILNPYKKLLKDIQMSIAANENQVDIRSIRQFYESDKKFMAFSFKQDDLLLSIMEVSLRNLKGDHNENLTDDIIDIAQRLVQEKYDMEALLHKLLGSKCLACNGDFIWGFEYARKIRHSQVEMYLDQIEQETGYKWFLPTAGSLISIKQSFIRKNIKKLGNGYFVCLPGLRNNTAPIAAFDYKTLKATIYNTSGTSAIIPVRCGAEHNY